MRGMVGLVAVLTWLACGAPIADAAARHAAKPAAAPAATGTEDVALKAEGGALLVPVTINDSVKLDFILDSGASVVTIPADVAMTLIRTGTLTQGDYLGKETFQVADGRTMPSTILRIRSLKVGDIVVHDVQASVTDTKGSLLLGQTFLARLTTWSIDNARHVLILGPERPGGPPPLQLAQPSHARHSSKRSDQASAAPASQESAATTAGGRPETAKGAAWDAAFYQDCLSQGALSGKVTTQTAESVCHCISAALQPLPLSRKKRLGAHSHEVVDATAVCMR